MQRADSLEKTPMLGNSEGRRRGDDRAKQQSAKLLMPAVGWHHLLNGCEFEQTPGDGEGQGSLEYCSPWGRKESDTTERLNNSKMETITFRMDKQQSPSV